MTVTVRNAHQVIRQRAKVYREPTTLDGCFDLLRHRFRGDKPKRELSGKGARCIGSLADSSHQQDWLVSDWMSTH
jgi:hypothetical protein